jgi:tRNA wybutosine-synthesizing protein 3
MSRCHVYQGDNRQTAPKLEGIADRVLLGLLPSSTYAWELAFNCLKEEGGIIHVHMNVEQQDLDDGRFVKETLKSFEEMGSEVKLLHLEDVKSYAPRVRHVVLDVEVRKL